MFTKSGILCLLVATWVVYVTGKCFTADQASYGPVVCISLTTFTFTNNKIIPSDAGEFSCPKGSLCVDGDPICSNNTTVSSACKIEELECGTCPKVGKLACLNETHFGYCATQNEKPIGEQRCPSGQFCGVPDGENLWPCTENKIKRLCREYQSTKKSTSGSTTDFPTKTTTPNPVAVCLEYGTFADETDPKCERYFYCYKDGVAIKRMDYNCPKGYIFNWITRRCVSQRTYSTLCSDQTKKA